MESSLSLPLSSQQSSKALFRVLQGFSDIAAIGVAFFLNPLLYILSIRTKDYSFLFLLSVCSYLAFLFIRSSYKPIWRYTSLKDLLQLAEICVLASIGLWIGIYAFSAVFEPLSVFQQMSFLGTYAVLAFNLLSANRVIRKTWHEYQLHQKEATHQKPGEKTKNVLVVGAGQIGSLIAKETALHVGSHVHIQGFIDDDPRKQQALICGIPVLGTTQAIPQLIAKMHIDEVIIALGPYYNKQIRRIIELAKNIHIKTRILPSYKDIISNKIQIKRIRDIEIEDLLQREPIELETKQIEEFLSGRRILVTGAGGSIGSELVRQLKNFSAAHVLLLDQSEFGLFTIVSELESQKVSFAYSVRVLDICDAAKIQALFEEYKPEIVLHAAAYKHVALMEQNPVAAIENNVIGTQILCEAAHQNRCDTFVLVSTDKAVRPTSVMGASKRLAEHVLSSYYEKSPTRFCAVRFGNVLGSSGSVIPIFRKQIESGGPVTVTHPDMTRYFMTIPEACQLILQAASYRTKENLFILDMGEPVKIVSLAEDMISLSGLKPYEDIDIVFTGAKQGEKIAEILSYDEEGISRSIHPRIHCGVVKRREIDAYALAGELKSLCGVNNIYQVKNLIIEHSHRL